MMSQPATARRLLAGCFFVLMWLGVSSRATAADSSPSKYVTVEGKRAHPTSMTAQFRPGVTAEQARPVLSKLGLRVAWEAKTMPGLVHLDLIPGVAQPEAAAAADCLQARLAGLRLSGLFESVSPDHVGRLSAVPNDGFFQDGTLWGLHNVGQLGGVVGADIGVTNAWDITVGSTNVIVAVIDSGIRYTHSDLAAQMWRNPAEIAGDGLDNDNNGYVDDVFGINAVARTGDPMDDNGHGTRVAGIIAAAPNNGHPHVGVAWNVRLMALKATDAQGNPLNSAIIQCIDYAIQHGAKILNCSFETFADTQLVNAFQRAQQSGLLVVASAGNFRANIDVAQQTVYPAGFSGFNFKFDNIITVAALDRRDGLANYSNFGSNNVHLGAPGVEIVSTSYLGDNSYDTATLDLTQLDGTSMAAAHVSGVAALIFSLTNTMTYSEVRNRILFTTTPVAALKGVTSSGGRVNAYRALTTVADNLLEVQVSPAPGATLLAGSAAIFTVTVNDLFPVTNATVSATLPGVFTNLVFINNGTGPDRVAGDNQHATVINLPVLPASDLPLTVTVTAPNKTNFVNTFHYRTVTIPPNDNFSQAGKVPDGGGVVYGDNTFGSLESGEPIHGGATNVANSLWWNFAPTNAGPVLVDTAGSTFDTVVAVYTGSSLTNLTLLAQTNDVGVIVQGFVNFIASPGTTYRIAVAAASTNSVGQVRLRVQFNGQPDTVPPVIAITNLVNGSFSVSSPPSGLIVTNPVLSLSGTATDPGPDAIGVNQIFVRANGGLASAASGTTNWTTLLFLAPGTNVIQVSAADFSGNVSTPVSFQVIYRVFDPFNDVFANALELPGASGASVTNNVNATFEPGEPLHAGKQGGKSVWYYFTAPSDGVLFLTTSNSTFDTLLAVYTGTRVDRLTPLNFNDDAPDGGGAVFSDLYQAVRAGTRYYIAVDGLAGSSGTILLNYSFTAVPLLDLTISATTGGVAFPASGTFPSNSTVNLVAVPADGYGFVTWTGDALALDNPFPVTVNRSMALTAVFSPLLLADNFESGGFRPGIGWRTNNAAGIAPWYVESATGGATNALTGGLFHARSGIITDSQTTVLQLTANCRSGGGSFGYRVSSEEFGPAQGDFFQFYLNGVRQINTNGESGWQRYAFQVPAGTNTFEWRYVKDGSSSAGLDGVFLDNVNVPLVEPVNLSVPLRFNSSQLQQVNGGLQFRVEGQSNQVYWVQVSSDLGNWITISTNYAPYGLIQFSEPQALTNRSRYYRVLIP